MNVASWKSWLPIRSPQERSGSCERQRGDFEVLRVGLGRSLPACWNGCQELAVPVDRCQSCTGPARLPSSIAQVLSVVRGRRLVPSSSNPTTASVNPYRTAGRTLLATLLVYGVLVGTNEGEFWPFSIYPMFSQGGKPWSRSVVRDVTAAEAPLLARNDSLAWRGRGYSRLPGEPFPLLEHGVSANDLSNFLSKTRHWDDERASSLYKMFAPHTSNGRRLLVMLVEGRITADDSVIVEFVPYALLDSASYRLNPTLVP